MKYFIKNTSKNQAFVQNIVYTQMHFWQKREFKAWWGRNDH